MRSSLCGCRQNQCLQGLGRERLAEHARSDTMARELAGGKASWPCSAGPAVRQSGRRPASHARSLHTRLDSELTRQLLQQAPAAYRTGSTTCC